MHAHEGVGSIVFFPHLGYDLGGVPQPYEIPPLDHYACMCTQIKSSLSMLCM